ncbi:MAG: TetR/AcrR family transcriptional regulator [Bacillota bacterium]
MGDAVTTSKDKILHAARKLFAHKGFENTSVDELAEEAQVAKGTIYVHFSGKGELLFAVVRHCLEEIRQTIIKLMNSNRPFLELFKSLLLEQLKLFDSNKDIYRIIITEKDKLLQVYHETDHHMHAMMLEEYARTNSVLAGFLERGMREGVLRRADPVEAAAVLQAVIHAFVFRWSLDGFALSLVEKSETVSSYYLQGMLNPKEATAYA